MTLDGTDIPVTLSAADKSSVEEAGFYAVTESDGGLLAVPRIENGELVVSIHPLNEGEFSTYFFLNQGVWKGYGGPDQPVTVVSPDGAVWKGEPASYNPFSGYRRYYPRYRYGSRRERYHFCSCERRIVPIRNQQPVFGASEWSLPAPARFLL